MAAAPSTAAAGGAGASAATGAPKKKEEPISFARRDHLRDIEKRMQARWAASRTFEADAPAEGAAAPPRKFMATFPYPYMNGRLHLGHGFTALKAEFAVAYHRLLGEAALFPFAFHCTGMPIHAAANKLKREIETGRIHSTPAAAVAGAGAGAPVPSAAAEAAADDSAEEEAPAAAAAGAAGANDAASSATSAAAAAAAAKAAKAGGKFSGKKTKAVAKAGAVSKTQYEIMEMSGIPAAEIPAFQDPRHWLSYFPPLGKEDLTQLGVGVDWRRSFITTDANPFYDSFIRWQFNTLHKRGKLGFGKRPTIYSPMDGQACADHDRASGEGKAPKEYTLIKLRLQTVPADHHAAATLAPLTALMAEGKRVYFVAATLRPETMYGQTNCFLLPEGLYGAFEVSATDVFVCSERSARNMAFQGHSLEHGKHVCLGTFTGDALMGLPLSAPYARYETVYTLPLMTISMGKGTGVVTSVPSDAPDDWAAYRDLKNKAAMREKYHISEAMVALEVPDIIRVPGRSDHIAVTLVDEKKIRSQNDKELLEAAKEEAYNAGFYLGVMLAGKYAGTKVADAKTLVRTDMIAEGLAAMYWEPEDLVMSRSGDECVVMELDQWYLKYGEDEWRGAVEAWIHSPHFTTYSAATLSTFESVLSWLKEWACSRSFGLGTRLPWDPQFVIESLSDSTIYMAYYTIAHMLQEGRIDPATNGEPGRFGIRPEQMTDAVWDYIFLEGPLPETPIATPALEAMRREFQYWYPMDLRVSGKDLINNHLTMALYNHVAMWGATASRLPQSYFCNGHVMVDGAKMAKSLGNFILLKEAVDRWGADAARFGLAEAGDGLEDANFERDRTDNVILRLTTEEEFIKEALADAAAGKLRGGEMQFCDRVFEARLDKSIRTTQAAFTTMRFRDVVQAGFHQMQADRDTYRDMCAKLGTPLHAGIVSRYIDAETRILAPIIPHFTEYVWTELLGKPTSVLRAGWPESADPDELVLQQDSYLQAQLHEFRVYIARQALGKKAKKASAEDRAKATQFDEAAVIVADDYAPWQKLVRSTMAANYDYARYGGGVLGYAPDVMTRVKDAVLGSAEVKPLMKRCMEFAGQLMASQAGRTEVGPMLAGGNPFDEYVLWHSQREYVRKALDIPSIIVLRASEVPAADAEMAKRAAEALPQVPAVHPYVKAAAAGAAAGGAAAAAAAGAGAGTA